MDFTQSFKKIVAMESLRFQTTTCPDRRRTSGRIVAYMLHEAVFRQRFTPSEAVSMARDVWPDLPSWNLLAALHGEPAESALAWETRLSRIILAS